ncbi:MAG TPA: ABC transporter ATP-binding protein [Saprospiraceae bacterium]|nr:ABC transporter ATP-binding protein [Saprospiraceae bacterium]
MSILSIQNVVKNYHNHQALKGVSFEVAEGRIFGLLGPNGAGKTSLIRIITTITQADEGQVLFDGKPLDKDTPSRIAYLPEERGLYKKMKVGEQLLYLARLKGMNSRDAKERIIHWLKRFEMEGWVNKKVEELSKGMQQKVQFVSTVLHEPKLLILDEPFSGLDPINTALIRDEIFELHQKGATIIFSTHRMEQVEQFCQEIVLINDGRIILEGEVDAVKERFKQHIFEITFKQAYLGDMPEFSQKVLSREDHLIKFQVDEGILSTDIIRFFMDKGCEIMSFREVLPSLNEVFIQCVNDEKSKVIVNS